MKESVKRGRNVTLAEGVLPQMKGEKCQKVNKFPLNLYFSIREVECKLRRQKLCKNFYSL